MKGMLDTTWPIEFRPTDSAATPGRTAEARHGRASGRASASVLPDDPALHRAALVYLSDMTLLDAALRPHGLTINDHRVQVASLDHALWFHRPARADAWLLYAQDSPNASGRHRPRRADCSTPETGLWSRASPRKGLVRRRAGTGAT